MKFPNAIGFYAGTLFNTFVPTGFLGSESGSKYCLYGYSNIMYWSYRGSFLMSALNFEKHSNKVGQRNLTLIF